VLGWQSSVVIAKPKTAVFFSDTARNRNRGFPVVLDGRVFQKLTVILIWRINVCRQMSTSTFIDGKPNSHAMLIAVFGPSSRRAHHAFQWCCSCSVSWLQSQ